MDATLKALAEPNRLRIVELLRGGPSSVNSIVERLHLSQPLVSKHLRVLSDAQLVRARANAQQRIYKLEAARFQELDTWLKTFRRLWEGRLDTLNDYLQELKREQERPNPRERKEQP